MQDILNLYEKAVVLDEAIKKYQQRAADAGKHVVQEDLQLRKVQNDFDADKVLRDHCQRELTLVKERLSRKNEKLISIKKNLQHHQAERNKYMNKLLMALREKEKIDRVQRQLAAVRERNEALENDLRRQEKQDILRATAPIDKILNELMHDTTGESASSASASQQQAIEQVPLLRRRVFGVLTSPSLADLSVSTDMGIE